MSARFRRNSPMKNPAVTSFRRHKRELIDDVDDDDDDGGGNDIGEAPFVLKSSSGSEFANLQSTKFYSHFTIYLQFLSVTEEIWQLKVNYIYISNLITNTFPIKRVIGTCRDDKNNFSCIEIRKRRSCFNLNDFEFVPSVINTLHSPIS